MVFFEFLRRFFLLHFPGLSQDREKSMEVSQLITKLRQRKASPYDPLRNTFSKEFAVSVSRLERAATRLKPLYEKTLLGGVESRKRTTLHLVRQGLASYKLDLGSFEFDAIRTEAGTDGKADIFDMDSLFESRIQVFRQPFFADQIQGLESNQRLAGLSDFDFLSLVRPFQVKGGVPGEFHPCSGPEILDSLLDLYFLISGLKTDRTAQSVLRVLADLAGAPDPDQSKVLADLSAFLAGTFQEGFLADVIRCVQEDPRALLRTAVSDGNPLDGIVQTLTEAYNVQKQMFLKTRADHEFQVKLQALFGEEPLEEIEGYDQETSLQLYQGGLPEFEYLQPILALKGFFVRFYQTEIRQILGNFFLEMEFSDNSFKTQFVGTVDTLDQNWSLMAQFEEDRKVAYKAKFLPILELAQNGLIDHQAKIRTKALVDDANLVADKIVQSTLGALNQLGDLLNRILDDLRSKDARILRNGAHLGAHKPHIVGDIETTLDTVDKTLRLLRLFSVDLGAVKRFLADPSP